MASLVLAGALAIAGCSGDDDSSTAGSTTSVRATTSSRASTTTTDAPTSSTVAPTTVGTSEPCPAPVSGSVAAQTSPLPSDVMVLDAIAVSTEGCTDTVRFDFHSGAAQPPGYRVEYQRGPFTQDGSGAPVAVAGNAFIVVRLEPASGFDFVTNREAYTGPDRIRVGSGAFATEVVRTGDFESVTTWVIGLRQQVPFSVQSSGAPDHRLTVTIG
jgi:hypothetical protein